MSLKYLNLPEKTAKVFYNHPELGYMFRTGDVGIVENGAVICKGRSDDQVR